MIFPRQSIQCISNICKNGQFMLDGNTIAGEN